MRLLEMEALLCNKLCQNVLIYRQLVANMHQNRIAKCISLFPAFDNVASKNAGPNFIQY